MRRIVTLSLATAAFAGAAGIAYAQAGPDAERAPALTRPQVEQRSAEAFARMDANGDGVLNRADREAHRRERFARLDANDDGELSPADREARRKAAFDRIDADDDGAISFEEFSNLREPREDLRGHRRAAGLGMRPGRPDGMRMARAADIDRDGQVTQAEFASAALARFDRIDVDKDGTISESERPADRVSRPVRDAG